MEKTSAALSIPDALASMATASSEDFSTCFKRIRKMFPDEVAEACLLFIASQDLNGAARSMASWLTIEGRYINILLASDRLPMDVASKALAALKKVDGEFGIRFLKAVDQLSATPAVLRALSLVPAIGDYGLLIPWLRKLCLDTDDRVKSRAVKLLCEIRPNKTLIDRQMLSKDSRVRANAIEALWHSRTAEATGVFQSATSDANHRVVGNGLIGLHLQGDPLALTRMIQLSESTDPLFRAAMAWCFGYIRNEGTIPLLYDLAKDPAVVVRKRALQSLLALQPNEPKLAAVAAAETIANPAEESKKPAAPPGGNKPATPTPAPSLPAPSFASFS